MAEDDWPKPDRYYPDDPEKVVALANFDQLLTKYVLQETGRLLSLPDITGKTDGTLPDQVDFSESDESGHLK